MNGSAADELVYELPGGGRALFTARAAGNLSTLAGHGHEHGLRHRERICQQRGLRWLCSSEQVHGAHVHLIDRVAGAGGTPVPVEADAHVTQLAGVGAAVFTADCLPVALGCGSISVTSPELDDDASPAASPEGEGKRDGAVAVVHAGWRGLAAGVIEAAVHALRRLPERRGVLIGDGYPGEQEIVAIVGPGAGVCCYEVGEEVHAAFAGAHRRGSHLDLRAIAHERLAAAGVSDIRDVPACTICDERFFSHRREGARAGRQAGVAWLS